MKKMRYVLVGLIIVGIVVAITFCSGHFDKNTAEDTSENTSPTVNLPSGFELAGEWHDRIGKKATMIITKDEGDNDYDVEISWVEKGSESVDWVFSGTFDPETGFLYYQDCRKVKVTGERDAAIGDETIEYEGGTGTISYYDEALIWQDDQEDAGSGSCFVRKGD